MSKLPTGDNVPSLGLYTYNGEVVAALGSLPLVDATGQKFATLAAGRFAGTVLNQTLANQTAGSGNTADLAVGAYDELAVDVNFTVNSGTPSVTFTLSRKGADGTTYYPIYTTSAITTSGKTSLHVGPGMSGTGAVPVSFGGILQISWTIGGTSPNVNFTLSVVGK